MKLLGSVTSPYVRKVRIVAIEKKLDFEWALQDVWTPETTIGQLNPLGKVPVLTVDDEVIYDSRVIVEYLDARAPTQRLIPDGNKDRAHVRTLEALADGLCDAAIAMLLERRFHPDGTLSEPWMARQAEKIDRALAAMNHALGDEHWMNHKAFTVADIACGVALGYLELRFPENTWKTTYPTLLAYYNKLMERPSFLSTKPA
jgi:glutathione S-transferase